MNRTTVNTRKWSTSHGTDPRGTGLWLFENREGERFEHNGTFTEARRALPVGEWTVLP